VHGVRKNFSLLWQSLLAKRRLFLRPLQTVPLLRHLADVDARVPLFLNAVELLQLQPDLAKHQVVVCVAVRAVVRVCVQNVLDGHTSDQNQIQLVPVL